VPAHVHESLATWASAAIVSVTVAPSALLGPAFETTIV